MNLQNYYLTSAREIMRINGTTKAPVVHHFGEAIAGAVTIRAFKRENMFARKNLELIDANASPFFHSIAATEWLIQRLEILSAVVLSASALLIVFLPKGQIDPGVFSTACLVLYLISYQEIEEAQYDVQMHIMTLQLIKWDSLPDFFCLIGLVDYRRICGACDHIWSFVKCLPSFQRPAPVQLGKCYNLCGENQAIHESSK